MRTLAIGDIHGCHSALLALLKAVQPGAEDRLVFLGDYIDRGPASRQVIETLLSLSQTSIFLRGNHEVMILDARHDPLKASLWMSYGGLDALFSYGAEYRSDWQAAIPDSHWKFLQQTRRFFETDTDIFVHACLDPEQDLPQQSDWLLFWEYFDRVKPHQSGKRIVCGHSPQRSGEIKNLGFAVCIDTDVARGGWLTCLDTNAGHYWQANETGQVRQGTLEPHT
jgi:serine/threonine protein phosphatase 1